jgi:hypothetical protein
MPLRGLVYRVYGLRPVYRGLLPLARLVYGVYCRFAALIEFIGFARLMRYIADSGQKSEQSEQSVKSKNRINRIIEQST